MSATCTRCLEEHAEHPFAVPGPPFTSIEVALMDQHYLSDHGVKVEHPRAPKIVYCPDCGFPLPDHARGCPRADWER